MKQKTKIDVLRTSFQVASYVVPKVTAKRALDLFLSPKKHATPPRELDWLHGFHEQRLENGCMIYKKGSGPKVLLIHGWEGRGSQMAYFAGPLLQAGYEVILVDGPAHGKSPGSKTNANEFSNFIRDLVLQLSPVEAIIGHSFGAGTSAVALARGAHAKKLVMIASPSSYEKVTSHYTRFLKLSNPSQLSFLKQLEKTIGVKLDQVSITDMGNQAKVPTLIVHDENDHEVGFINARELKEKWEHAELFSTKGYGHRKILRSPEAARKILEFLKK